MATRKIDDRSSTFYANLANIDYVLEKGKTIDVDTHLQNDVGIAVWDYLEGRRLQINGTVKAEYQGIDIEDLHNAVRLEIGVSGRVEGDTGIRSIGNDHVIRNAGVIAGDTTGLFVSGYQAIVNTGTISGGRDGVHLVEGTLRNSGTISGGEHAIVSEYQGRIINSGTIDGDVVLSGGNDLFVFKSGEVLGAVFGGWGDDTFVVRKSGLAIVESNDQGHDVVKSSVSFTLAAHVDELKLIGSRNIGGIGNSDDNEIHGNAGSNQLNGGIGNDVLEGGKGSDFLTGSIGADAFHFNRGTGRDTVVDFAANNDDIHLGGLKGASDFADMLENHTRQKDDDLWITYGDDTVVLKNMTEAQLQTGDFTFN